MGELRHTAGLAAGYRPGRQGLVDLGLLLMAAADEIDRLRAGAPTTREPMPEDPHGVARALAADHGQPSAASPVTGGDP